MDKPTHKQVANYLANDLGLDRKAVEDIIRDVVERRNVPAMVNQAIERYFHKGPDGLHADDFVKDAVYREIRKQLKDIIESGGRKAIDAIAQSQLDAIMKGIDCPVNAVSGPVPQTDTVMCVEFTKHWFHGLEEQMVALFDVRDVSEEDVVAYVNSNQSSHPSIAVIPKQTYETVFRSLRHPDGKSPEG